MVQARDDARRATRGKVAYKPGDEGVAELDAYLRRETPRLGLWLDISDLSVDETVDTILSWAES